MITVTRDQMRAMDRVAIEEYGVPGVVLMENAGRACLEETLALRGREEGPVLILAGRGNNGGDGFVVARHLLGREIPFRLAFFGDLDGVDASTDAGVNLFVLLKSSVTIPEIRKDTPAKRLDALFDGASVVVDALLGTGAAGAPRPPYDEAIERANGSTAPVCAVDAPSGLDCDTGEAPGAAINADVTVTFGFAKQGFARQRGPELCGRVVVADIGLPPAAVQKVLGD